MDQHELMIRVLREAGGVPVEDELPPAYQGRRADIVFRSEDVIVEVKTITTDRANDPKTADALGIMFSENAGNGAPVIFGQTKVRLNDLPKHIAEKALRIVGQRIQHEAKEANRQIRATKSILDREDAYGLVVFVTPPFELDRRSIGWLVNDRLRGGTCRSINGIMIIETPLSAPVGANEVANSFLSFHGRDDRTMPLILRNRIGEAWGRVTGQQKRIAREEDFFLLGAKA